MPPNITVMRSLGPHLTKTISLGSNGRPVSDGSACRMHAGTAVTTPAPDASTLAWKIEQLASTEAIVLGSIRTVPSGQTVNVVATNLLAKLDATQRDGVIARTRDHIEFPTDEPAWMLLDCEGRTFACHQRARGGWRRLSRPAHGGAGTGTGNASYARVDFHRTVQQHYQRALSRLGR